MTIFNNHLYFMVRFMSPDIQVDSKTFIVMHLKFSKDFSFPRQSSSFFLISVRLVSDFVCLSSTKSKDRLSLPGMEQSL